MTHLRIELNNIPENVTPNTIEKLYSTVTANDYVYDDDDLKGTLLTTSTYEDIVLYLEAKYPGLHINATKLYVRFLELEVLRVLLANNYGDGTGITRTELSAITTLSGTLFLDNTTLTSLDDLLKFTGLTYVNYKFAQGCTNLVSVTFPSNMREIGAPYTDWTSGPFSGCISLLNVTLNEGLTTLGYRVFHECTALTTINIPSTVTALGIDSSTGSTFESCTGLKTVTGSCTLSTLGPYSFHGCNQLEPIGDIDISNISIIPYHAFYACNKLNFGNKLANMPNLTTVGGNAFEGCWLLSNIDLSHVTSITDTYAFRNCRALTSVDLSSLSSLPNATFEGCTSLTTITGGSSLTSIGDYGFANCSNLSSIDLSNVTYVGYYAFVNCSNLTSVDLSNVVNDEKACFRRCSSLKTVTLSQNKHRLGEYYFENDSSLETINLSEITRLDDGCLSNCTKLDVVLNGLDFSKITHMYYTALSNTKAGTIFDVQMPAFTGDTLYSWFNGLNIRSISNIPSITKTDTDVFKNCPELQTIDLSLCTNLTSIERFLVGSGCPKLKKIILPQSVTSFVSSNSWDREILLTYDSQNIDIICYATTPPTSNGIPLTNYPAKITVYVPDASVSSYLASSFWNVCTIKGISLLPS